MTPVSAFLDHFSRSRLGILIDDIGSSRAALVAPAQDISADVVNRALALTGGLTFVALSSERVNAFMLPSMTRPATFSPGSDSVDGSLRLLTSVEAREGISTGISAADRATTLRVLGGESPHPRDLIKPGHVFPVEARQGGVLVKAALPEGALDIVRLCSFSDAALHMDLLRVDGNLMTAEEAQLLGRRECLPVTTISELISYRLHREPLVTRAAEAVIPTRLAGDVRGIVYRSHIHDVEHVALVKGDVSHGGPVVVRVQVENTIADVFGGGAPSSRALLQASLRTIQARGSGVFLYLRRAFIEDRAAYAPSMPAHPSPPPATSMMREYGIGAQILRDLGVTQIEVLSNSARALDGLASFGITIISQHPIPDVESKPGHAV